MRELSELNLNRGGVPVRLPPPTPDQISYVEKLVRSKLPTDYVNFLTFSNGGHPELDTFGFEDGNGTTSKSIDNFLSISSAPDSTDDVVWNYTHLWPGAPVLPSILPIAKDGGGNLICLDLTDSEYGSIVLLMHDPVQSSVVRTGLSFKDMIDSLHLNPDYI